MKTQKVLIIKRNKNLKWTITEIPEVEILDPNDMLRIKRTRKHKPKHK
jgi:hypothetical protein